MKFSVQQIAEWIGATIEGDAAAEIDHFSAIEQGSQYGLSFLANPKYESYLYTTEATAVIVDRSLVIKKKVDAILLRVKDPYASFSALLKQYEKLIRPVYEGISDQAFIHTESEIDPSCYIAAGAYISKGAKIAAHVEVHPQVFVGEGVQIGEGSVLYSGVRIGDRTMIGKQVVIQPNAVIGSDGFGFVPDNEGVYTKVPQLGNVVVGDHVEIGACCTIDRATFGSTIIEEGVKLDNQVHVAHNAFIGAHTAIAAQSGIAGSTKVGKRGLIGGQVGIAGHLIIGDDVKVQAQSGIARNVKNKEKLQGTPALEYANYNKSYVRFKNLEQLEQRIRELEKQLKLASS
ncbi:MAG: UDP-3-O-(3-hydroxymyristoyl)glucosamine N-acyltransferase [Bacteroidota bacterium]|jgi:UDP-3-O-[3-hydroxymyristoyl] glucosamine N-acyltransferase